MRAEPEARQRGQRECEADEAAERRREALEVGRESQRIDLLEVGEHLRKRDHLANLQRRAAARKPLRARLHAVVACLESLRPSSIDAVQHPHGIGAQPGHQGEPKHRKRNQLEARGLCLPALAAHVGVGIEIVCPDATAAAATIAAAAAATARIRTEQAVRAAEGGTAVVSEPVVGAAAAASCPGGGCVGAANDVLDIAPPAPVAWLEGQSLQGEPRRGAVGAKWAALTDPSEVVEEVVAITEAGRDVFGALRGGGVQRARRARGAVTCANAVLVGVWRARAEHTFGAVGATRAKRARLVERQKLSARRAGRRWREGRHAATAAASCPNRTKPQRHCRRVGRRGRRRWWGRGRLRR